MYTYCFRHCFQPLHIWPDASTGIDFPPREKNCNVDLYHEYLRNLYWDESFGDHKMYGPVEEEEQKKKEKTNPVFV